MPIQLIEEEKRFEVKDSELEAVDDGDAETVYVYRQIPPGVNRQITKKHTTRKPNKRLGTMEEVVDSLAVFDDLLDYALVDWKGIQHKGKPVECQREFKLLLDVKRKVAIVERAGANQVTADEREQSFRSTP